MPLALSSNWVFALCPFLLRPASSTTPTPNPVPGSFRPLSRASFSTARGAGAGAAQACSPRPLNASSPKTPKSKRSSSQTLPRAAKRQPAASSSRGSIPAPMVRPGREAQAARWAAAPETLGLRGSARRRGRQLPRAFGLNLDAWPLGGTGSSRPGDSNSFPPNYIALLRPSASPSGSLPVVWSPAHAPAYLLRLQPAYKSGPTATSVAHRGPLRAVPPGSSRTLGLSALRPTQPCGA